MPRHARTALVLTVAVMFLSFPSWLTAAPQTSAALTANGLYIRVEGVADDVYRVQVRPAGTRPPTTTPSGLVQGDASSVELDHATGRLTLRAQATRDEAPLWSGTVRPLRSWGRAAVPALDIEWDAAPGEFLCGLGERFDSLDQYGKTVAMWIRDDPGQGSQGEHSYYCTPVLFSGRGYALFATDNPEGEFQLNALGDGHHRYRRAGAAVTFYLAAGRSLRELVLKRGRIQGPFRGVPDWAWGPWMSKNSYETQDEAEQAIRNMARHHLPVSAIVQEAWKGPSERGAYNLFDPNRWPDVPRYFELCRRHGLQTVLWQVPIIHPLSPHYAEGLELDAFVKAPDGSVSIRTAWMTGFANVDFTNPRAVAFWKDLLRPVTRLGIAGFKADDGEAIKPDDVFSDGRRGWQVHNEFSTLYNTAVTELLEEEGVDGMIWARSGSLGIERAPALWAGDQYASWPQLRSLLPAGLSASISGMPFWGHDIGGYVGNPSPELYIRWLQFGAFSPLMQYHGVAPREPWLFGPEALAAYRLLACLRMNLRPTLKALGKEAAETGLPIMRPMTLEFPADARFRGDNTQYMLGPNLLVAPVLEEGATGRRIRFPEGTWHHVLCPVAYDGPSEVFVPIRLQSAPVFVREGAGLRVELDDGSPLGRWTNGAPVRTLTFDADRALVRDLRAPATADVLVRQAPLSFQPVARLTGDVQVAWSYATDPGAVARAAMAREGGRFTADLATDVPGNIAGREQYYRIEHARKGGEPDVLFEGSLRWQTPFIMTVQPEGPRVVASGRRIIRTQLRNRADRPVPAQVVARAGEGARLSATSNKGVVPAGGDVEWSWPVDFSPINSVADTPVYFTLYSAGHRLADHEVTYTRPLRWVTAGPFPTSPRGGFHSVFPPEWITDAAASFQAGDTAVRWVQLDPQHAVEHDGIDFGTLFGPRDHAVAYAMTRLRCHRAQDVELRFGSDDTLTVWLDGEKIHSVESYRSAEPDQEVVPVRLAEGVHTLVVKVAQDVAAWRLLFRLTGPQGRPASGVSDGFSDFESYAPDRKANGPVVTTPNPLSWSVAGPFPFNPDERTWTAPLDVMAQRSAWPPEGEGMHWQPVPPDHAPRGVVDLNNLFGDTFYADAYACATLHAERPVPVEISCGSDDGIVIWLNGAQALEVSRWRGFKQDEDRVRAVLTPGPNRLLCRIRQGTGEWKFQVSLWDVSSQPARPWGAEP